MGSFIKLISNYKFNSILLRNFLIIILLLFLPLGGFSVYVYVFNKNVVEEEISQANLVNVTQVKDTVDSIFTEMNGFSLRMLSDKSVEAIANSQIPSPYEYSDLVSLRDLQEDMSVVELTNMFIDSIYIYFENQQYLLSSREGRRVRQSSSEWWYKGYGHASLDNKSWLYSDSGSQDLISYYRRLSDAGTGSKGFVMVNLDTRSLAEMMTNTIRQSQNIYIVNESGEVLYNQDSATRGMTFPEIELEVFGKLGRDLYSEVVRKEGQERVISIAASSFSGWNYVSIIPLEEYQEKISDFNRLSVIFFVFSGVSALVLAFIISVKNYRPIMRIIKWIENRDDDLFLKKQSDSARLDEIKFIATNIVQSEHEREELFEELAEKYKLLRKAQAIALQSQIHPHFLFNTLETINWKVMKLTNSSNEASDMIRDLSKLLRYSLSTEEELIMIEKEMEFVRIYLDIQKMRYQDKMDVQWKLPHEIGHYQILKLMVQPIVENAIYHGIKPSRNPGTITIAGDVKSDALIIQIRDNGVGMKQSMVEKINASFYRSEAEISENMHIGLTNVNHRIHLMFGRRYGLTVRSEYGRGTVVEMFIPKIERKR